MLSPKSRLFSRKRPQQDAVGPHPIMPVTNRLHLGRRQRRRQILGINDQIIIAQRVILRERKQHGGQHSEPEHPAQNGIMPKVVRVTPCAPSDDGQPTGPFITLAAGRGLPALPRRRSPKAGRPHSLRAVPALSPRLAAPNRKFYALYFPPPHPANQSPAWFRSR